MVRKLNLGRWMRGIIAKDFTFDNVNLVAGAIASHK